jgi:hypothetical protein
VGEGSRFEPGYETVVERQIREAAERGAFDGLPGRGKPLPQLQGPADEMWWARRWLEREGVSREMLLPPSVQLRKELDRLPKTLRALRDERAVRDALDELDRRVVEHMRYPSGPRIPVRRVDVEAAVARWRAERAAAEQAAAPPPAADAAPVPARRRRWWRRDRRERSSGAVDDT